MTKIWQRLLCKILEEHQKYPQFANKDHLYKFVCLPNGYYQRPRKFTKALKPPSSKLHLDKVTIVAFLDDWLNIDKNKTKCLENTKTIINAFQNLNYQIELVCI